EGGPWHGGRTCGTCFPLRVCRAHDVLLHHHVARTADDEQMLHIVAANEDETPPAVDRCLVDDGQSQLASAHGVAAEPPTAEPAQQPERQREQAEHHDHEHNDFEVALSFAEQGVHHSSPYLTCAAPQWGSPEWLMPLLPWGKPEIF